MSHANAVNGHAKAGLLSLQRFAVVLDVVRVLHPQSNYPSVWPTLSGELVKAHIQDFLGRQPCGSCGAGDEPPVFSDEMQGIKVTTAIHACSPYPEWEYHLTTCLGRSF